MIFTSSSRALEAPITERISSQCPRSITSIRVTSSQVFFWELVTLIDVMLLGHWLEMRLVKGASSALEELVKIMPSVAHLKKNGEIVDVGVDQLKIGDKVLVLSLIHISEPT